MTKKDYIKIAAVFSQYRDHAGNWPQSPWRHTAAQELSSRFADMLAQDNPRFDRARFLAACGLAD